MMIMTMLIMASTTPDGKGAVSPISTTFKERLVPEDIVMLIVMLMFMLIELIMVIILSIR